LKSLRSVKKKAASSRNTKPVLFFSEKGLEMLPLRLFCIAIKERTNNNADFKSHVLA
jgi:hypothetical protein